MIVKPLTTNQRESQNVTRSGSDKDPDENMETGAQAANELEKNHTCTSDRTKYGLGCDGFSDDGLRRHEFCEDGEDRNCLTVTNGNSCELANDDPHHTEVIRATKG